MPAENLYGQVALLLCESLLHALVEEGALSRNKAIEVADVVVEILRDGTGPADAERDAAASLVERIAESLAAK